MPVVPFNRPLPQAKAPNPQPKLDDTYLAIAAAGMHEQGRLFAATKDLDASSSN